MSGWYYIFLNSERDQYIGNEKVGKSNRSIFYKSN